MEGREGREETEKGIEGRGKMKGIREKEEIEKKIKTGSRREE